MMSQRLAPGLTALVLFATNPITISAAQAVDTQFEEVIVKSPKNAAMMPYDDVYVRLKRMEESKLDRVRMQIKVTPKDESVKLADVRVAIVNDATSLPVRLGADGTVTVPMRAELYKTDAEIRSNQPKGSLAASLTLARQRADALRQASRLTQLRVDAGESARLEAIEAQRIALAAQSQLADQQRALASAQADVFRALGGGWVPETSPR